MDDTNRDKSLDVTPCRQARPRIARAPTAIDVERSIPASFEQWAALHPGRTALASDTWQPTYGDLNAAANRLAHHLLACGGARGDRVALLMRHDTPLLAAALAVLKAGSTAVVLNPTDPPERLGQVLEHADPGWLVTDGAHGQLAARVAAGTRRVVGFETHAAGTGPTHNPVVPIAPSDMAFLVYTSGSTGCPKAVIHTHRTLLHNVRKLSLGMELQAEDRILLLASLSGIHGVNTLWCALLHGATLCPFPVMDKGVTGLAEWMVAQRITLYASSASLFRHFVRTLDDGARFPGVRLVRLASEPATSADFAAFRAHFTDACVLFHALSSSETSIIAYCRLTPHDRITAGRLLMRAPADGMEILLLDEQGREVPAGRTGEIIVRSRYLSPGYWRDAALTASRFSGGTGNRDVRVFRSGDLGRRTADGALLYMGRTDAQVKIRGYRIDVSEIEDALAGQADVEGVAVCVRADAHDEAHLVAYVVARLGRACTADALRQALRGILPGHMIPAGFVFLERFPLTPHGKIDRERLRRISPPAWEPPPSEGPTTDTEALLVDIWREVFGCGALGRQADFFDLGGDSLRAAVVAARVHAALDVEVDLRAFVAHPTLSALAGVIDDLRHAGEAGTAESAPRLVRVSRAVPFPLSLAQEHMWQYAQTAEAMAGYTMACSHRIRGPLDVDVLRESMTYIAQRHDILRTTVEVSDGAPVQVVHPPAPVALPLVDLSDAPDAAEQALQLFHNEARRPFAMAGGRREPLVRFVLVRVRHDEHWLLRVSHHLIADAWSWTVYFRELALLYEAKLRGEAPPLPACEPLQYGDYAAWQRRALDPAGPRYRATVDWWCDLLADTPPPLPLPFGRPTRLCHAAPADGVLVWGMEPVLSQRLAQVARAHGVTYYMVRLAAFSALLAAHAGQPALILGAYVTQRSRIELQNMFGYFAHLVPLRLSWDPTQPFHRWLTTVRTTVSDSQAHGAIPYEQLCEAVRQRGLAPPGIHAIFSAAEHTAPVRFAGLELTWYDFSVGEHTVPTHFDSLGLAWYDTADASHLATMPWGFSMVCDEHLEDRRCSVTFDARLYDPVHVRAFISCFVRLLDAASRYPDLPLATLLAMSDSTASPPGAVTRWWSWATDIFRSHTWRARG